MRTISLAVLAILMMSSVASSEEGYRDGFTRVMGLGVVGAYSTELAEAEIDANRFGLHVDTRLGGFLTDRWVLQWSGRGVYLVGGGSSALMSGMTGIQTTYYFRDSAPCFYVSGLVGPGWSVALSSNTGDMQWAGTLAVGYEWRRNHSFEFEALIGLPDPGDPFNAEIGEGRLMTASIKLVSYYH